MKIDESVAVPDEGLIAVLSPCPATHLLLTCVYERHRNGKRGAVGGSEEKRTRQSKCVHQNSCKHIFASVCFVCLCVRTENTLLRYIKKNHVCV